MTKNNAKESAPLLDAMEQADEMDAVLVEPATEPEPDEVDPNKAKDALRRAKIVGHLEARNWASLVSMMEQDEGEITDESEALEAVLEELSEERLDLLGEAYLGLVAWAEVIGSEIARLAKRKAKILEMSERIPAMIKITKTVETPLVTFKLTTSKAWKMREDEDVPPAEYANELFTKYTPESWVLSKTALKSHVSAADKLAAKLAKRASRKRKPEPATPEELAELAKLEAIAEEARAFGHIAEEKRTKISRSK